MKRLLLLAILAVSACTPAQVDIAATAKVAIELTDAALPTNTAVVTPTPVNTATPVPSPTPSLDIGSSQIRSADGMTMMYVPAGEFVMGYDQGRVDETPTHNVYLDAFWIDKTEVTGGMYATCAAAGKCPKIGSTQSSTDLPVTTAAWEQANAYCSWAGAHLPTEAQWEKAARGTDGRLYPWGMDPDSSKMTGFTALSALPAVGSVPDGTSPYGVLDMAGSAFEWVADWYSASYYATSPRENPKGPDQGSMHVIRGGWFEWTKGNSGMVQMNITYRSTWRNGDGHYGRQLLGRLNLSSVYSSGAGFRCAMTP